MTKKDYIAILGPTASGKSGLAMKLAEELNGEIVSCDSVQLYRGLNIGSAKPTSEEQEKVKHHLIDILDPDQDYDAAQFGKLARETIEEISSRGKLPIVVGGTGLYYRFLTGESIHHLPKNPNLKEELKELSSENLLERLRKLDPRRAEDIHLNDRYRLVRAIEIAESSKSSFSSETQEQKQANFLPKICILLDPPRKVLHERIEARAKIMLEQGLIGEVKKLRDSYSKDLKSMSTIGYKEANAFIDSELPSEEELLFRIICATRQYAKRQVTFFKKTQVDLKVEDPKESFEDILSLVQKKK